MTFATFCYLKRGLLTKSYFSKSTTTIETNFTNVSDCVSVVQELQFNLLNFVWFGFVVGTNFVVKKKGSVLTNLNKERSFLGLTLEGGS